MGIYAVRQVIYASHLSVLMLGITDSRDNLLKIEISFDEKTSPSITKVFPIKHPKKVQAIFQNKDSGVVFVHTVDGIIFQLEESNN